MAILAHRSRLVRHLGACALFRDARLDSQLPGMKDLLPSFPLLRVCVLLGNLGSSKLHLLFIPLPKDGPKGTVSVHRNRKRMKFIEILEQAMELVPVAFGMSGVST